MRYLHVFALAATLVAAMPGPAAAAPFLVTLDTSALSGEYLIAFGLVDGDGTENNFVSLTDFDFGGGSATAGTDDCTFGGFLTGEGCSGDLSSGVLLDDSGLTALFTQHFTAGSTLSYVLDLNNDGPGPDTFFMSLCTTGLTCFSDNMDTGALLVLELSGGPVSASSFMLTGASLQNLPAPVVSDVVPEPATLLLLGSGLAGVMYRRRQQARRDL